MFGKTVKIVSYPPPDYGKSTHCHYFLKIPFAGEFKHIYTDRIPVLLQNLFCCNLRIFLHDEKNIRSGLRFAAGRHLNINHQIQSEVVFFCQSITLNILSPIIALCTGQDGNAVAGICSSCG